MRSLLAAAGIALAVLLVVLLVGLGYGVVAAGSQGIAFLDQDFWVTGGPVELSPTSVGGVDNKLTDAHAVAAEMESRESVARAVPLAFQTVYVSRDGEAFDTVVGVGTGEGARLVVQRGRGFAEGDVHYANGSYDGPMTNEVVVDQGTARLLNVSVGDTIHVGGTTVAAERNEFRVVGVSHTYSTFLGAPTAMLHLGELQTVSGTSGTDRASLITVSLAPGADREAVRSELEREYPELTFRTNREQLQAVLGSQATVLASAATLVVLAVVAGAALVVNALALLVYQQRRELAALKAAGVHSRTLVAVVAGQGLLVGLVGAAVGLVGAPLVAAGLNAAVERLVGFPNLVKTPLWVLGVGGGLALVMGLLGASVAGWRVVRLSPLSHLEG
jgi:putative ABC transport system permease protein